MSRIDILEQLRQQRNDARSLLRDPSNDYRCFLGRHAMAAYKRLRCRAMAPASLPRYTPQLPFGWRQAA